MAEVVLLGSGSADGWPNPWCTCGSCQAARAHGPLRARTSALVDRAILIDPGPDLPTRTGAAGVELTSVTTVLITHPHPDHLDPSFLLAWDWAGQRRGYPQPLVVAGPPAAVQAARPWIGPRAPVEFVELSADDQLLAADWVVRALPAAHNLAGTAEPDGTALLYELTGPSGRILWATDTARLPHDSLAASYDLVFLEETFGDLTEHQAAHLDLPGFAAEVAALRAANRLAPGARVVAVHLSHHNPADLAEQLADVGALAGTDLARFRLPSGRGSRTLLTGGARSGKSARAESLAAASGHVVTYVATAPRFPDDPQWVARVAAHRRRRPENWRLQETADLVGALAAAGPTDLLLVDCLTLWLMQVVDQAAAWDEPAAAGVAAERAVSDLIGELDVAACDVLLVTNEVGSGVVPATASGRLFQDLLGAANAQLAGVCDRVELLVAGHPVVLRDGWHR